MMENFFGLMKNELLYVTHYDSVEEFEKELKQYIWWYNNNRIKLRLKGMSPVQYRAQYYKDLNNEHLNLMSNFWGALHTRFHEYVVLILVLTHT